VVTQVMCLILVCFSGSPGDVFTFDVLVVALVMCLLWVCFSGDPGDVFIMGMF
jgi:hypothetical protein